MVYQLRSYQQEASDAAMKGFASGKPFLIVAATAAGKSLIIADIAKRLGKPLLVLVPSREILLQNYEKMVNYGIEGVTMYSASVGKKKIGRITIATVHSIHRKPQDFAHFDYCVFDEVHGFNVKGKDSMYVKLFREANIRNVCGLTATPFRLDNKFFGSVYTGCIKMLNRMTKDSFFRSIEYKIEMKELVEMGYLTKPIYHTEEADLRGLVVNTTGRDYTESSLEDWGNRRASKLIAMAPELDKRHKRILVFATTVPSAESIVSSLEELGIRSAIVTAKTPNKKRQALLDKFREGEIKWMVNVGTLTTGFDLPVLDCVAMLRPTFSVALYMQMVGRGMRLDPEDPNKKYHLYDLTNNVEKFGRVETIRVVKEDGWKDMLESEVGRLDNTELFRFDTKNKKDKPPKEITLDYLLSRV